jgi:hypothetical protein
MGCPRLTIRLFPAQPGAGCSHSGSLCLPLEEVTALCEWLLGQEGEFDAYLRCQVVRLAAFQYVNTSRAGKSYTTVQLRPPRPLRPDHSADDDAIPF